MGGWRQICPRKWMSLLSANIRQFRILLGDYTPLSVYVSPRHKSNLGLYSPKSSSIYIKGLSLLSLLKCLILWYWWGPLRPLTLSSTHRIPNSTSVMTIGSYINFWCASAPPHWVLFWLKPYAIHWTLLKEECNLMALKGTRTCTSQTGTASSEFLKRRVIADSILAGPSTSSGASL